MSDNLAFVLIFVLILSHYISSGVSTNAEGHAESGGVMGDLIQLGEDVYNVLGGADTPSMTSHAVQGRGHKKAHWTALFVFMKGFMVSGVTAAATFIIKLFIMQAFFVSKIALILGSYFLLEKVAHNLAASKSTTTRKIVYHSEPHYVYPDEHELTYTLPEPSYSVSHATADVEIEDLSSLPMAGSSGSKYYPYSETTEVKSYPYSTYSETSETKSFPPHASYSETSEFRPQPQSSYMETSEMKPYQHSTAETSEVKTYPYSNAETPEVNSYAYPESNSVSDDTGVTYEQIPAVLQQSYSIHESDSVNQGSKDQYYYVSPSNSTPATNPPVSDLQKAPIHVIAEESPASRPLGRRVYRRLPIVQHRRVYRF